MNTGSNPRGCIGSNPIVGAKFVLKRINIKASVGDEYSVLDIKRNVKTGKYDVLVRHATCGEQTWISYQNFIKGSRCKCEGLAGQASSDELKRYIKELSCEQYECCDDEILDRKRIHIKNTATGEIVTISYKMALQEITQMSRVFLRKHYKKH